jgi:hypothetical protein
MIATTTQQIGNVSDVDLCKELLTDRERLVEELAVKNSRIVELEAALKMSGEMIRCLSRIRGEPE